MFRTFFYPTLLTTFILMVNEPAAGVCDIPQVKRYGVSKATHPPIVDGNLNDVAWDSAPWTEDFENILGDTVGPVSPIKLRTRVKILWDDSFVYIAAEVLDPFIVANLSYIPESGEILDSTFEMFLDLERSNHNLQRIQMNAVGAFRSLYYNKPPADGGVEVVKNLGEAFRYGILNTTDAQESSEHVVHEVLHVTNEVIKNPRNLWNLEWAIPWPHISRKRDSGASHPQYSNFQFMRSGWPPSSNAESSPTSSRGRQRRRRYLLGLLDNIVSSEKYHLTWSSQPDRDVMNPQWWGTVEFLDTTTSQAIVDSEYSARYFLNILYQLEQNHFESFGTYSEDLSMLMPNTTIFKECSFDKPVIEVHDGGMRFDIHLKLDDHKTGHISQDRLLWFS